ncbi:MAG: hypothetical protein KDC43_12425 [Saprospiraceae bacterium]|nr:hypothetical protein [Saprospiraceae bacterium]MCB0624685.1 hypothetical protein [Saprospiraceae bacterium]
MYRIISFLLFVGSPLWLFSQDLHIYYNAQTEQTAYVIGGDTISQPRVKRGDNIYLHLINYNNYLYDVEIRESQQQVLYSSNLDTTQLYSLQGGEGGSSGGGGALSMLSLFSGTSGMMGFGGLINGQLGIIDGIDFGLNKGFGEALSAEEQLISAELRDARNKYQKVLTELSEIETEMGNINSLIETAANAQAVQTVATREVQRLQYNPRLTPAQIKSMSSDYLSIVFDNRNVEELSINDIWKMSQRTQSISQSLDEAKRERNKYERKLQELQLLNQVINQYQNRNFQSASLAEQYQQLETSLNTTQAESSEILTTLDDNISQIEKSSEDMPQDDFDGLVKLRYLYTEMENNEFAYHYRTTAANDNTHLEVTLRPRDDLPEGVNVRSRRLAPVAVPTKGGLKINASFGLSFGQFFDPPQSYFVRDSVILSEDKDSFTPTLTSFLHFYKYNPNQVSLGGSFGIGLPIFNNQQGQSIAFFLGPSLIMGGSQRIVLSTGVMGARVERLTNGYQVGDAFDVNTAILPTDFSYQLGYFVGLSINVIN